MKNIAKKVFGTVVIGLLCISWQLNAETLYSAKTSGLVFKDEIHLEVFDDPDHPDISCYVALPDRSFKFDEQSDTALTCVNRGRAIATPGTRQNVFKSSKGIFFKYMVVDRIYDSRRNVFVYMSYTKKMGGDNASAGISVVPIQ